MADYTPNTDEIRNAWIDFMCDHSNTPLTFEEAQSAFDRWLDQEHQKWYAEGFKDARRGTKMTDDKTNFPEVTRIEVIDNYGRAFVRYYDYRGVTVVLQDDKRTLKIFANEPTLGLEPRIEIEERFRPLCDKHPGHENHCATGRCGACWLCKKPESVEVSPNPNEPNTFETEDAISPDPIEELQRAVIELTALTRSLDSRLAHLEKHQHEWRGWV